MPATNAEMIAYRWGQARTLAAINQLLPEPAMVEVANPGPLPEGVTRVLEESRVDMAALAGHMVDEELYALGRLGRRQFKYWAERGASTP